MKARNQLKARVLITTICILTDHELYPGETEDLDGFEDEDGYPDQDNDQNKINYAEDKCPVDAEIFNAGEDNDRCPDT
jgi:OOP family OmpA-OmpF porin